MGVETRPYRRMPEKNICLLALEDLKVICLLNKESRLSRAGQRNGYACAAAHHVQIHDATVEACGIVMKLRIAETSTDGDDNE